MATVPRRGNFTRRKRRFSYVGKYEPSDRPMTPGYDTEDYSSAEEVDIDDVDHPKILLAARQEEENRTLAEKAAKKTTGGAGGAGVSAAAVAAAETAANELLMEESVSKAKTAGKKSGKK